MPQLRIYLLGPPRIELNGHPLTFNRRKVLALLVYLAASQRAHQRDHLATLLYPGYDQSSARSNLRKTVSLLNQQLHKESLDIQRDQIAPVRGEAGRTIPFAQADRHTIQIHPEADYKADVQQFADLVERDPAQAIALYRGDFLSDFYLPDSEPFEEWASGRRAHYQRQVLNALDVVTAVHLQDGRYDAAETLARQQLNIDNLRESGHRQLMEALARNGRRRAALSHYETFGQLLQDELGIAPSSETEALVEAIRGDNLGKETGGAGHEARGERPGTVPHNLPKQTTPFIGREAELTILERFVMDPSVRLVTIVGPGGIGKTRLAVATAERILASGIFSAGHFFIDLAPLKAKTRILPTLAETLNFPQMGADDSASKQHLLNYLRQKKLLLVFDNFEHLLDGAELVSDILQAAPGVMILATSRERLNLRPEQVYPIDGLTYADLDTAGDVIEYTAVQLFLHSAQRNQPDFALLKDDDLTYLTRICHLVAGMPLAIELAASWVDMLTLEEIASELQQGLDLLETELRDMPERHRSVRASFDYTWRRLDEAEQAVFTQLSIFRGGFTRTAAQEVTGASLRQLSNLVSKSLIRFDTERGRYEMHELLRQYSAEKLGKQPELEASVYNRHSNYYLQLLAGFTDALKSKGKQQALSAIEADLENVWLAWDHGCVQQNIKTIGNALEALWRFYWDTGRRKFNEFEQAVAEFRKGEAIGARGIVLGRLLAPLGRSYIGRGHMAQAREMLKESLELLQRFGTKEDSLIPLLFLAEVQDSMEESNRLYREGLDLARAVGDPWAIGHAFLFMIGNARLTGDYQEALQFGHKALNQFKQNGDEGGIAATLAELSRLAFDMGRYDDAQLYAQETIMVTQGKHSMMGAMGLYPIGKALFGLGEYGKAEELFRQGLILFREFGRVGWETGQFWLGEIAFVKQEYAHAAQSYRVSLAAAIESENFHMIALNHLSLGRVGVARGRTIEAKKHFHTALQTAMQLNWRPLLLDCLVGSAELFAVEGDSDYAAHLATIVKADTASRAMAKERGANLLASINKERSSAEVDAVRQRSQTSDLRVVATQLLRDLGRL